MLHRMSETCRKRENKHLTFIPGSWSQYIFFTYWREMQIPRKVKQVPKQLLNDYFLCFCWIWCNYSLCSTSNTGDDTACVTPVFTASGPYCHQRAAFPLMWNYFKDARTHWVSKTSCTPKREKVLVVRGTKSQQAGRWLAQFPCTGSLYSVPLSCEQCKCGSHTELRHGTRGRVQAAGKSKPLWGWSFQGQHQQMAHGP